MDKNRAFIVALVVFVVSWYGLNYISSFDIGFDIPLIGHISLLQPFASLQPYIIFVGLIPTILVYYLISRNQRRKHN